MKNKIPKHPGDQTDIELEQIQNQLKECQEISHNNLIKTNTHKIKSNASSQKLSQQISGSHNNKSQISQLNLSANLYQETNANQSIYSIGDRSVVSNIGSYKNSIRKKTYPTRRKKLKELKDVILNQKVNGLKELFFNKLKRNNPYSSPVEFHFEDDIEDKNFFDKKGVQFKQNFEKIASLISVYNIVSSIFIFTLSMVFPEVTESLSITALLIVGMILFFGEIVLNFITIKFTLGRKLQTLKQISQDYIKHKFTIDGINFLVILLYIITREPIIGYFRLVALLKIPDCMEKIQKLEVYFIENYYNEQYWSLVKVFIFNFCFAHMLAILLIGISKTNPSNNWLTTKGIDSAPWYEQYIWSYYWGTTIMLTIGFGDILPVCYQEALCMIFIETISCMVLAYNISCVGSLIAQIRSRDIEKSKNLKIFKKLADKQNISQGLSWKINSYVQEHTNIKKLFNIEEEIQFVEKLPVAYRTDYLKEANKKIFQNLFFFTHLMQKTLFALAEKIVLKITHPQQSILTAQTNSNVFILKTGEIGYISRKVNRKFNKYVFDKLKVEENGTPFLLNTNFITKKRSNYGIKSIIYSVLYCLNYQNLIETLQETHLDYELFCRMRDKSKYKIDEFQVFPCEFCTGEKHTKFSCPKLHFMPIEQHIINRYINEEKKGRNKRDKKFDRNQIEKQSALVRFLYYKDIYDEKKKQQDVNPLTKKYKKQKYVIDQLKAFQNDSLPQVTFNDKKSKLKSNLNTVEAMNKFQSSFLENTSQIIKIQINRALGFQKGEDDVWLLDLDLMKNYKDYFAENNPCNLVNAFNVEERIKKIMEKNVIDFMANMLPQSNSSNQNQSIQISEQSEFKEISISTTKKYKSNKTIHMIRN